MPKINNFSFSGQFQQTSFNSHCFQNPAVHFSGSPWYPENLPQTFHHECVDSALICLRHSAFAPYITTGHTRAIRRQIFVVLGTSWFTDVFLSNVVIRWSLASLEQISFVQSASLVASEPRYRNTSTCSSTRFVRLVLQVVPAVTITSSWCQ